MLAWNSAQRFALQNLNLKRWVLRAELNKFCTSKTPVIDTVKNVQVLQDLVTELSEPEQSSIKNFVNDSRKIDAFLPDSSEFFTFSQADIKLRCDENYSLLTCTRLRFDWILPPIAGFRGALLLMEKGDADFLLLALERSGLKSEAEVLQEILLQPIGIPNGHIPLPPPHKQRVTVGSAARVAKGLHLFHPQYVYENPWHKRLLWLQILKLQDY